MLPVRKHPTHHYRTLEEIRERKDTLLDELQADNQKFTSLWNQLFIKREESSKSEFIGGIIANSITAIDVFLMVRKLLKSYRMIFGKKNKKK